MRMRTCILIAAALAAGLPLTVEAQHFPPPIDEPQSVQPAQPQPAPAPAKPTKKKHAEKKASPPGQPEQAPVVNLPVDPDGQPPPADAPHAAPAAHAKAAAPSPSHTVACSGAFAKNSSHIRLAQIFGAQNVTFTEVDGPQNTKLQASVLYPKDPKRHLEVMWNNETSRANTSLISINGQSTWTGPKGLHLGLPIAAVEKLNGKPFQLAGFDQDNAGSALDWQGGALDKVPGGCKVSVRLAPDPKATTDARKEAGGATLMSSDASVRALKPTIAEILIGY